MQSHHPQQNLRMLKHCFQESYSQQSLEITLKPCALAHLGEKKSKDFSLPTIAMDENLGHNQIEGGKDGSASRDQYTDF